MAETWTKTDIAEDRYEIKDTVVIRTISKSDLQRRKAAFEAQIAKLDADLAKITTLEAK